MQENGYNKGKAVLAEAHLVGSELPVLWDGREGCWLPCSILESGM